MRGTRITTGQDAALAIVRVAALLHDWGKATSFFQDKLRGRASERGDPLAHELVSATLARALFDALDAPGSGSPTQDSVRAAVTRVQERPLPVPRRDAALRLFYAREDAVTDARDLALWLILSHHRLPDIAAFPPPADRSTARGRAAPDWSSWREALRALSAGAHVFDRPDAPGEIAVEAGLEDEASWCEVLATALRALGEATDAGRPLPAPRAVALAGRIALICADRSVSMSPTHAVRRRGALLANTRKDATGRPAPHQGLADHLCRVADAAVDWIGRLADAGRDWPSLTAGDATERYHVASTGPFAWQNRIESVLTEVAPASEDAVFGVVRAGTGCGKTRGAARIMQALRPEGARFSFAAPMRTLTMQTAAAYRDDLGIATQDLVRLVGAAVSCEDNDAGDLLVRRLGRVAGGRTPEDVDLPDVLARDPDVGRLTSTPVSVSTIDHLMPAVAQGRTNFVLSVFRVATADLVLDELDSYGPADLVAIGRLVHLAGFFGRRVLAVSATLTPELAGHMEAAHRAGAALRRELGWPVGRILSFYADERTTGITESGSVTDLMMHAPPPAPRPSQVTSWTLDGPNASAETPLSERMDDLVARLRGQVSGLVQAGLRDMCLLVRLSRIESVVRVARALDERGFGADVGLGILCWHGRMLEAQRGLIEHTLRHLLDRKAGGDLGDSWVFAEIARPSPDAPRCLVVIASPVAEIGHEHDYDAVLLDLASLTSTIQAGGRVRRHRPEAACAPNIQVLPVPLHAAEARQTGRRGRGALLYTRPGPEASREETPFALSYRVSGQRRSIEALVATAVRDHPVLGIWDGRRDASGIGTLAALERQAVDEYCGLAHPFSLRGYIEDARAWAAGAHFERMAFRASTPRIGLHWDPARTGLARRTLAGGFEPIAAAHGLKQGALHLHHAVLRKSLGAIVRGDGVDGRDPDLLRGAVPASFDPGRMVWCADLGLVSADDLGENG